MIVDLRSQEMKRGNNLLGLEINSKFYNRITKIPYSTEETIKDFEGSNKILAYDLFVLTNISSKIQETILKGEYITPVSINISAKTLSKVNEVVSIIKPIAQYLILEITETCITNIKDAEIFIKEVRSTGAKIALDDLNHSYQGVPLVHALNPDIVKFVLPNNSSDSDNFFKMIEQVLNFNNNIDIVIENVETENEFQLISNKFPKAFIQGFYFNKGDDYLLNLKYCD